MILNNPIYNLKNTDYLKHYGYKKRQIYFWDEIKPHFVYNFLLSMLLKVYIAIPSLNL